MICCLLLVGCDNNTQRDAKEEQDTYVQKGLEFAQIKYWDKAILQFESALDHNPKLARPDLELALIYQQHQKKYVRAIYHYERYLEKRPDSEKKPLIIDWIRQAQLSLAAEAGETTGGISEKLIRLTRENNLLRKQLTRLTAQLQATQVPPTQTRTSNPTPSPTPKPIVATATQPLPPVSRGVVTITPSPKPKVEPRIWISAQNTYRVQPGDTLSKIAKGIYGDSRKWTYLYQANRDRMRNENDLKVGQIITIPRR